MFVEMSEAQRFVFDPLEGAGEIVLASWVRLKLAIKKGLIAPFLKRYVIRPRLIVLVLTESAF